MDPSKNFRSGVDPKPIAEEQGLAAKNKGYDRLRKNHLDDFTSVMGRVILDLGEAPEGLSVTERLKAYKAGAEDPHLEALMFHFGRYLSISCSRGPLPANLQGLWNDRNKPAWYADYHTNINIQMNYWLSGPANLTECAKLIKLAKEVKTVVDDKAKYTDWSQRDDIKAELKVDLILLLGKHGYPPVDRDEVYKEIFEQAENFKKYQNA